MFVAKFYSQFNFQHDICAAVGYLYYRVIPLFEIERHRNEFTFTKMNTHTRKSFGSDLSMWFIRMKFAQATTTYHRRHRCHRRWWLHCIPNPINMKYLLFVVRAPLARWTSERRIAIEDISLLDLLKRNTGNNVQSKCYINTSHSPLHAGVTHWPKCQAINFIEIIHQKAISSNIRVHLA